VVAFGKNVDLVDMTGFQRVLPFRFVELFADSGDKLRSVKIEMHLPRGQRIIDTTLL
jgi:hypothetical protein